MPAYAGLISSVGLGFVMQTAYLLPLTVFSLVLALVALGYRAGRRRGYGPFVLGLAAAVGLVAGKFVADSDVAVYASIASLIGASLWNSWPKKGVPSAPTEPLLQLGSIKKENEHGYETQD
jgi:mercuric ion transport protein